MKKKSKNIVHKKRISKRRNLYGGKNGKMPAPCGNLQADCMADSWIEIGNIYKSKISGIGNIKIYRCSHKDVPGSHFCASDGASGYWDNIDRFYEID